MKKPAVQPNHDPREVLDFGLGTARALEPSPDFLAAAAALGVEFEPGDVDRLGRYLGMLLAANEKANLTSITDAGEAWTKHILDSLTLLAVLAELPAGARVIDVGTGGGVPGVPLAIVMPHLSFTLLEATGKKVEFLRQAAAMLGLGNVEVVQGRAERLGQDRGERGGQGREGGHRERYDAVIARAVGPLNVLAELTVPLAKAPAADRPSGVIALIKGQKAADEVVSAAEALRQVRARHEATLDTPTGRIVVLTKDAPTPRTYPRADGEPKRSPLGGALRRGGDAEPEA